MADSNPDFWIGPPLSELPVALFAGRSLSGSQKCSLIAGNVDVYQNGVLMHLRLDIFDAPGRDRLDPFSVWHDRAVPRRGQEMLRVGVTLSTGETAETFVGERYEQPEFRTSLQLMRLGEQSSLETRMVRRMSLWLQPFPPEGTMTLHFMSDTLGIAEGSADIDTGPWHEARSGVRRVD